MIHKYYTEGISPKDFSNHQNPIDLFKNVKDGNMILSHKQMLQRLPISTAQAKVGNTSENLLNEIRQIIYSLYWVKEIIKKV